MTLLRWIAVTVGVVLGVWLLRPAMVFVFTSVPQSWWDVIAGGALFFAMLSVAPASVAGLFWPRVAGVALLVASLIIDAALFILPLALGMHQFPGLSYVVVGLLLPSAALVWLRSGAGGAKASPGSLRPAARWTAVLLAGVLGAAELRGGIGWVHWALTRHQWFVAAGGCVVTLSLLPIAVLGVVRPRAAAYGAIAMSAASFAYFAVLSAGPWHGVTDAISRAGFTFGAAVPFAALAALLWYSTREGVPRIGMPAEGSGTMPHCPRERQ